MIVQLSVLASLVSLAGSPPTGVDYPIVCVRAPRPDDTTATPRTEVFDPAQGMPGTDLVIVHPGGKEEVLVRGGTGAIVDPYVSFDAQWVFYARFHAFSRRPIGRLRITGSDIYKIHVKTRRIVRLTDQEWTPNRGANPQGKNPGVFNLGPCPLPGGKVIFTSSRNGLEPAKSFTSPNQQIFVMNDDGTNVECVGHMNLGSALHPVVLRDGRVIFSSYESQGVRDRRLWGIWIMNPDGTQWGPVASAFVPAHAFHFQGQTSDGRVVFILYYNANNNGYGQAIAVPEDRLGQFEPGSWSRFNFRPKGLQVLTPWADFRDRASKKDAKGQYMGKVTDPAGAPNGDLLMSWTDGPANELRRPTNVPRWNGMIVRARGGKVTNHPSELDVIKASKDFNYFQPHALVPYRAIYGVDEPRRLPWRPNDGNPAPRLPHLGRHLPQGTPFGLVGTSSLIKRDTKPRLGYATYDGLDPFNTASNRTTNWMRQGADAGYYGDGDIWAIRVLQLEVGVDRRSFYRGNGFFNWSNERVRILGEYPVRKQVLDPDGNPDTSFLVKIPADTPFTFQTLDRNGMVLNMSQTWHQVRPGEARMDCGGCHAHLQEPTLFEETAAAGPTYRIRDFARTTSLLDAKGDEVVLQKPLVDIEYMRDVAPIFKRSCMPCHSKKQAAPAAKLVLDDDDVLHSIPLVGKLPGTYRRLAFDRDQRFGYPTVNQYKKWFDPNASRYVRKFQSRRSLLIWKAYGRRLDGWTNDQNPTARTPGDPNTLYQKGEKVPNTVQNTDRADLDYVDGGCKAHRIDDAARLTLVRWIDLGAPLTRPDMAQVGHFVDHQRPVLTVTRVRGGYLVGAFDAYLDPSTLSATVDNAPAALIPLSDNRWGIASNGTHVVARVRDKSGNEAVVDWRFANEQFGSFRPFGTGCRGTGGVPVAHASGEPAIGRELVYWVTSAAPRRPALHVLGGSDRVWGAFRLPLELSALGAAGCRIYNDVVLVTPAATDARGTASASLRMPFAPGLVGAGFFTQFWIVDRGANGLGLTFSNAIETRLGSTR